MSDQYARLVERLAVAVWGQTGSNGLSGTQIKHGERLAKLEEFRMELTIIWRVIRWLALGLAGLIGVLSTDTLARILADLLRVLKS
tara:strand:- start:1790 stop:2047 length:258 start_codon:yes stop_codon:yes gene_type:complete